MWFFPPAAGEKFFGGVFTFELNPPLVIPVFGTRGGFNSRSNLRRRRKFWGFCLLNVDFLKENRVLEA